MLALPVGFHASASAAQIVGGERELEQLEAPLDAVTDAYVRSQDRRERPGLVDAP
jgi:hypothetical protein